jgi:hypothetical protein
MSRYYSYTQMRGTKKNAVPVDIGVAKVGFLLPVGWRILTMAWMHRKTF